MKEWGSEPDDERDHGLQVEAVAVGLSVLASYLLVAYLFIANLVGD